MVKGPLCEPLSLTEDAAFNPLSRRMRAWKAWERLGRARRAAMSSGACQALVARSEVAEEGQGILIGVRATRLSTLELKPKASE